MRWQFLLVLCLLTVAVGCCHDRCLVRNTSRLGPTPFAHCGSNREDDSCPTLLTKWRTQTRLPSLAEPGFPGKFHPVPTRPVFHPNADFLTVSPTPILIEPESPEMEQITPPLPEQLPDAAAAEPRDRVSVLIKPIKSATRPVSWSTNNTPPGGWQAVRR